MSCYVIKLFGWFYNQTAHFEFTNSLLFNQIVPGGWLKTDFAAKKHMLGLLTSIEGPVLFWWRLFQRFLPPAKEHWTKWSFWADSTTKQRRGGGAEEAREEIKILRCLQPQPVNIEPYTEMCLGENSKLISHFSVIVKCTDHYSGRQIRRGEYPSNPEVD